jgi:hypothetical protein
MKSKEKSYFKGANMIEGYKHKKFCMPRIDCEEEREDHGEDGKKWREM